MCIVVFGLPRRESVPRVFDDDKELEHKHLLKNSIIIIMIIIIIIIMISIIII